MKDIYLPNSLTYISGNAFKNTAYYNNKSNWDGDVFYVDKYLIYANETISGKYNIREGTIGIANSAFDGTEFLTGIEMPNSLKWIGDFSFRKCIGLTEINFSTGLNAIGWGAFQDCSSLKKVIVPDSVQIIDVSTFENCSNLTDISLGNGLQSIGQYAFKKTAYYNDKNNWEDYALYIGKYLIKIDENFSGECIIKDGTLEIASSVHRGKSLRKLVLPNSITTVRGFYEVSISEVVLPASITKIDEYGLGGTVGLQDYMVSRVYYEGDIKGWCSIELENRIGRYLYINNELVENLVIPEGVTTINEYTFQGNYGIKSVELPNSVTSIGDDAFWNCSALTRVVIPDSVTSIGNSAFSGCSSLTSVEIPEGITSIGNNTFNGCYVLASVKIPSSVTSIGERAFYQCYELASIEIPNGVTTIEEYTFYWCSALKNVEIPNSVTSIGHFAFAKCTRLMQVMIPDSVTAMGAGVFSECDKLMEVGIPDSVITIGGRAFESCEHVTIYCEAESSSSGWDEEWNYSNCPVVWDCNNNEIASDGFIYTTIDGIRYGLKDGEAIAVKQGLDIEEANIPATVFYGENAFNVIAIGDEAFKNCSSLTSVVIPDSVTSIGEYAFTYCSSLTSVVIPDSITSIGYRDFAGCTSLTSVEIGNGVTSIGGEAFSGCNSLRSIIFNGTLEQWNAIWKGRSWKYNVPATEVVCKDGKVAL